MYSSLEFIKIYSLLLLLLLFIFLKKVLNYNSERKKGKSDFVHFTVGPDSQQVTRSFHFFFHISEFIKYIQNLFIHIF